ncbi:MAG: hypothetical protein LBC51_02745 [Treponema sp.]|jgi:TolB-like protein|nr:hypothetical protein [Treponema sp.]
MYPSRFYTPLLRGRRVLFTLFLSLALTAAVEAKDTLAILPFTGAQGEDGETIAELFSFQKDLTALFSPVPRTSISRAIRGEQGFQMESGMTDPDTIASLGRQLGATYVVAGTVTTLGSQNLLVIAILHTETLQQIAGDIQTYKTIEEIDARLPAMAKNVAAAVQKDTSKLPLLALPPVQMGGGADSREADALAQILAVHLVQSGAYAVYPRTKSLEQVQEEYGVQFNGDTADEYLPGLGKAANPRLVLSVTARRLGSRSMFNAAVINLETGVQEAGDTVNYQSLSDGVDAMEKLALKLTDPKKAAELAAAREATARARAALHNPVASDAASFTRAISAINNDTAGGEYTITLSSSFTSGPVAFTSNTSKTITLKGDASVHTISSNGGGNLFTVPAGITLVLENNITLNDNNQKNNVVYVEGGTLNLKTGSTVRGGTGNRTIRGNLVATFGGGVYVGSGTFTMSGGTISGNSAPGYYSSGGGVYVDSGGTFTMSGGTISGNSASGGGGVSVSVYGTFRMSGGTINGNTASVNGGGVHVFGGTFIKSGGGTIDATNRAKDDGRVAYVYYGRKRDSAAGPGVNLDSNVSGSAGGWE